MRTKIIDETNGGPIGFVTIIYTDAETDETCRREFMLPSGSRYVREYRNGDWMQVCANLAHAGQTLTCDDPAKLAALIRTHYRRMRAEEYRAATA